MTADAAAAQPPRMKRFGQGAILTPANLVTITRIIVAIPTLLWIRDQGATWLTWALRVAITASDSLDGWLARKLNQTSAFGAFLDPVAEKLMVAAALIILVQLARVDAIIAREAEFAA